MAIRGPSSSSRPVANRRAYRPDRQVYRQLRKGSRKADRWFFWAEIAILVAAVVGLVALIRWAFF